MKMQIIDEKFPHLDKLLRNKTSISIDRILNRFNLTYHAVELSAKENNKQKSLVIRPCGVLCARDIIKNRIKVYFAINCPFDITPYLLKENVHCGKQTFEYYFNKHKKDYNILNSRLEGLNNYLGKN
jgi:hypothetical protein